MHGYKRTSVCMSSLMLFISVISILLLLLLNVNKLFVFILKGVLDID